MWNVSAGHLAILVLVGIVTAIASLAVADIIGALLARQHRDVVIDQWDAAREFGAPAGKTPQRPLRHRARRVWKRTYTSRAVARARATGRKKAF